MSRHAETATPIAIDRTKVDGACPTCGASELAAYPVHSEGGWFDIVKCQECLTAVSRDKGPLLGPIQLLSDLI